MTELKLRLEHQIYYAIEILSTIPTDSLNSNPILSELLESLVAEKDSRYKFRQDILKGLPKQKEHSK